MKITKKNVVGKNFLHCSERSCILKSHQERIHGTFNRIHDEHVSLWTNVREIEIVCVHGVFSGSSQSNRNGIQENLSLKTKIIAAWHGLGARSPPLSACVEVLRNWYTRSIRDRVVGIAPCGFESRHLHLFAVHINSILYLLQCSKRQ